MNVNVLVGLCGRVQRARGSCAWAANWQTARPCCTLRSSAIVSHAPRGPSRYMPHAQATSHTPHTHARVASPRRSSRRARPCSSPSGRTRRACAELHHPMLQVAGIVSASPGEAETRQSRRSLVEFRHVGIAGASGDSRGHATTRAREARADLADRLLVRQLARHAWVVETRHTLGRCARTGTRAAEAGVTRHKAP